MASGGEEKARRMGSFPAFGDSSNSRMVCMLAGTSFMEPRAKAQTL